MLNIYDDSPRPERDKRKVAIVIVVSSNINLDQIPVDIFAAYFF